MTRMSLALLFALGLAGPALAQDAAGTGSGIPILGDFSTGQPRERQPGELFELEAHGDWTVRCVTMPEGTAEPCHMYQMLRDSEGVPTAEVIFFPLGEDAQPPLVAGAEVVTPLGTLLTASLELQIEPREARLYPFNVCEDIGCISRIAFLEEELDALRAGTRVRVTLFAFQMPRQPVNLDISLRGFTAAYATLEERL